MSTHSFVSVTTHARLHMGFFDLSGALNRHFGSIGVALNEQTTRLTLGYAPQRRVTGLATPRADKCLTALCAALQVADTLSLHVEAAIPEHVGLGSGTQMSLAIGAALNAFYGLGLSVRDIAAVMDRGLRSGIGIGVFEQGGLVVDGGRGENTVTPPLLVRLPIPEQWRFILVFDKRGQGLHGQQEIQAFKTLPPFPREQAEKLCYLLLMQGLPAVAEGNINGFGAVISQLQQSVGEHFAPAQGGVFTSREVATAISWLAERGAVAIGQTSWGPTGFCLVDDIALASALTAKARKRFLHIKNLQFMTASVCNEGAIVQVHQ